MVGKGIAYGGEGVWDLANQTTGKDVGKVGDLLDASAFTPLLSHMTYLELLLIL